jgi:formylglycine-generating enzyme required for sulfatase activity
VINLVLVAGSQPRAIGEAEFPLAVGVSDGALVVGAAAEAAPSLWILTHPRGLSIQPQDRAVSYNGARLAAPTWLNDGDEIEIGDVALAVAIQGNAATLTATPPTASRASNRAPRFGADTSGRRAAFATAKGIALAAFAVLVLGVAYVIAASPLTVRITPEADAVSVSGWPPPIPIGGRYLAFPGTYVVAAEKEGYQPLRATISVSYGSASDVALMLQRLPGQLQIVTPPIEGATILVDGTQRSASPATLEIDAGIHEIRIDSERYMPESRRVEIEGMGVKQALVVPLRPAWGTLSMTSVPDKAVVRLDGKDIGETPITFEALQGAHELEVTKEGWKPIARRIEVQAGTVSTIATIELERVDGTIALASDPSGASVLVNAQFRGQTPLTLSLVGDSDYQLTVSKAGYKTDSRRVRVEGGRSANLAVRLEPELGTVFLTTNPPGATLTVNGRASGSATQRLSLQTVPQTIEIAKDGYETFKTTFTPQHGVPKQLDVTLKTVGDALKERVAKRIVTSGGQRMALIYVAGPVRFTVGSPRRDAARRSNEFDDQVELSRSFLMSEKEVTNAEFRKFKQGHDSGAYQGTTLDGAEQPVVNVSWDDAARYANWLSQQEGLEPAYREQDGRLTPVVPLTNGYRLPTEIEWEFTARYDGGRRPLNQPLQFPWGDAMPPAKNSGNFAHDGSGLPFAIPGHVDAYVVSAPAGRFPPNKASIYDLGGNVAEWCHDYYDVQTSASTKPRRDPTGPAEGRFHVIKGSSWRSGSATELRFAYRDYADKPRDNVGFRIARYVDP